MNIFIRFGQWLEKRRVVRKPEFDLFKHNLEKVLVDINKTSTAVEVAKLKLQIDRIELYVGLKREPIAVTLPGEARIS
jgi:hypothetical protein